MIGTKLAHYEITSHLGSGGMGDVYQARDARLGRSVAVKFLPDAFARDADRVARFEREARVLASLNHPNIAAIYGLEEANDKKFLVMELVPGETLAARIARGPLPLQESLALAKQIAEALEAANEKGIIHRDLKPANITVTPEGKVKVLDFGLAKESEPSNAELSNSPTLMTAGSLSGVILGTAAYMSPEQAKGRTVDQRADVWAFGAVLYEMLTGQRCFEGEDVSDTIAAVLRATPAWSALPADTPPAIRRLLRRCLEKDVRMRLSDMAMVRIELREAETEPQEVTSAAAPLLRPSKLRRLAPYVVALFTALVSGLVVWRLSRSVETPTVVRFAIDLPAQIQLSTSGRNQVAISPDGTQLIYVANNRLYLRALGQPDAAPIPGTEVGGGSFARIPFFSPDGQWIGFWQTGQLRKIALSGGAPVTICSAPNAPFSASWGPNDEILVGNPGGIFMVKATGGALTPLISLKPGELAISPQVLAGGRWLLYVLLPAGSLPDQGQVVVVSRDTREQRVLIEGARDVRYVPSGHLLYGRGNTLLAQAFDPDNLRLSGGPVPVLDGVANGVGNPGMHLAISSTGALLYVPTIFQTATTKLVQIARDGTRSTLADINGMAWFPRFSPDGSRIAYGLSAGTDLNDSSDLWVLDVARGARTRVTFAGNNRYFPTWTRDGTRLTFADGSTLTNRILSALADGSGGNQTLVDVGNRRFPTSWSPDGKTLAMHVGATGTPTNSRDVWMLHVEGDKRTLTSFVDTPFEERGPIFSPNGRWIAYTSTKSGQDDVYARPFPGPGSEVTISVGGGEEPVWAPTGRELFYRHDGKLMSVKLQETASSLIASTPVRLFDDSFRPDTSGANGGVANYDISPNGQRFVMIEEPRQAATEPIRLQVILNWTRELKQRVPVNK